MYLFRTLFQLYLLQFLLLLIGYLFCNITIFSFLSFWTRSACLVSPFVALNLFFALLDLFFEPFVKERLFHLTFFEIMENHLLDSLFPEVIHLLMYIFHLLFAYVSVLFWGGEGHLWSRSRVKEGEQTFRKQTHSFLSFFCSMVNILVCVLWDRYIHNFSLQNEMTVYILFFQSVFFISHIIKCSYVIKYISPTLFK